MIGAGIFVSYCLKGVSEETSRYRIPDSLGASPPPIVKFTLTLNSASGQSDVKNEVDRYSLEKLRSIPLSVESA
jgi:hypothetical protein